MKLNDWYDSCRLNEAIDLLDIKQVYSIMCEHFGLNEKRIYLDASPSVASKQIRSVILWQNNRFYSWSSILGFDKPGETSSDIDELLVRY